ncbi:hypothetical protein [Kocuria sabuli]|uniref:hypothetical protein n=1 Tax=Kocuria sabuli TaxID=3071448 RepID=UPI0034D68980
MTSRADLWELIDVENTAHGVRRLCRVLGVSRTAHHEHRRDGGASTAALTDAREAHQARAGWAEHRRGYGPPGSPLSCATAGMRRTARRSPKLLRLSGIEGAHRRRRGKYGRRSTSTATAPDLVERRFSAEAPNKLGVADITYLRTWEGFFYLAVVIDACSRKVVDGRWPTTCAPSWCWTRSQWPS